MPDIMPAAAAALFAARNRGLRTNSNRDVRSKGIDI